MKMYSIPELEDLIISNVDFEIIETAILNDNPLNYFIVAKKNA